MVYLPEHSSFLPLILLSVITINPLCCGLQSAALRQTRQIKTQLDPLSKFAMPGSKSFLRTPKTSPHGASTDEVILDMASSSTQDSNRSELAEEMDFGDVILMFFFISGLVINLLAFFIALIIFWNTPIIRRFIVNMISADLMLLITGFYLKFKRVFRLVSVVSCKIIFTTDIALLHVSCYTIVLIAFYRYSKLFPVQVGPHSLGQFFSKPKFLNLTLLILWIIPFIIASPMAYYSTFDSEFVKCDSEMPYDFQTFYNLLTFVSSYVIPGIAVTFLYSRIISKTRSAISMSANSSDETSRHVNMMRFLTYVVLAFWILHLPFWCCNLGSTFEIYEFPRSFLHFSIILTYVNAALNPFLYALLSVDCARCSCACIADSLICEPIRCLIFLFCSCDPTTAPSMSSHSNQNNLDKGDQNDDGDVGNNMGTKTTNEAAKITGKQFDGPQSQSLSYHGLKMKYNEDEII
ncbi:somatostatin receptor type 2-like [Symsagittifera roscoffensis]|uniref:somatostatin receptor type 2-like n=1 Tax=Symsagittifera roscoffensis TaxID=84072 RepID=UPI00307B7333